MLSEKHFHGSGPSGFAEMDPVPTPGNKRGLMVASSMGWGLIGQNYHSSVMGSCVTKQKHAEIKGRVSANR